jgi:hypothetical protein
MWLRPPAVAGLFYPADPQELIREIDFYLDRVPEVASNKPEDVLALIAPHAGYPYSGPVAAYSYKPLIDLKPELVVILAPSHHNYFAGASVFYQGQYQTPLGSVETDQNLGEKLFAGLNALSCSVPEIDFSKEIHAKEHSLEVQIPFLQKTIGSFKLLPIIIGTSDLEICQKIANNLCRLLVSEKRRFMVIISTDLSHYHPYKRAIEVDHKFIEDLKTLEEEQLKKNLDLKEIEACGAGPILTGIILNKKLGAKEVKILKYANSGDTVGDKERVVGYLAASLNK